MSSTSSFTSNRLKMGPNPFDWNPKMKGRGRPGRRRRDGWRLAQADSLAACSPFLFVMRPHSNDFGDSCFWKDLVDEAVLDVYPSRKRTRQISCEFLARRGCLVGIPFEDLKQSFGLGPKSRLREFLGISSRLRCEDQFPVHQPGSLWHFSTGVLSPRIMDSFIPGIEAR